jgi:hypothetical protein
MAVMGCGIIGPNLARYITAAHGIVIVVANLRVWNLYILDSLVALLVYLLYVL